MYGQVLITTRKSLSSIRGFTRKITIPLRPVFRSVPLYRVRSTTLVGAAVILRGGRHVGKAKPAEHRSFHRRRTRPFANRLRMGAERNCNGVRQDKSGRKSDQPGESFLVIALDR